MIKGIRGEAAIKVDRKNPMKYAKFMIVKVENDEFYTKDILIARPQSTHPVHRDILAMAERVFQRGGKKVVGNGKGGFLRLDKGTKTIEISGSSEQFGMADATLVEGILKRNFPDYRIGAIAKEEEAAPAKKQILTPVQLFKIVVSHPVEEERGKAAVKLVEDAYREQETYSGYGGSLKGGIAKNDLSEIKRLIFYTSYERVALLDRIAKCKEFPAEARELAGMRLVEKADFDGIMYIVNNAKFPATVRAAAKQKTCTAALDDVIETARYGRYDGLMAIARNEQHYARPIEAREEAGIKLVNATASATGQIIEIERLERYAGFCPRENLTRLKEIGNDQKMPKKVRAAALDAIVPMGLNWVRYFVKHENCNGLTELSNNAEFPEIVRKAAENGVEAAKIKHAESRVKGIRRCRFASHATGELMEIANDLGLPEQTRDMAEKTIGPTARYYIDRATGEGDYGILLDVLDCAKLPQAIRELAKENLDTAIKNYYEDKDKTGRMCDVKNGLDTVDPRVIETLGNLYVDYLAGCQQWEVVGDLLKIANNANMPESVRTAAHNAADKVAGRAFDGRCGRIEDLEKQRDIANGAGSFEIPQKFIETAKKNLEPAASDLIERYVNEGDYGRLGWLTGDNWPGEIRLAAKKGMERCAINLASQQND